MSIVTLLRLDTRNFLRTSPAWQIAVFLLAAHVAALALGEQRYEDHARRHAEIRASEEAAVTRLRQRAADLAARTQATTSKLEAFEAEWGPRNPGYANAWTQLSAIRQPAPLSVLAGGVSDLYPVSYKTSWRDVEPLPQRLDPREPDIVRGGWFDVSFVVLYVLPIAILLLTVNLIAHEREAGTWVLVRSSSTSLWMVLFLKSAPRLLLVLACLAGMWAQAAWRTEAPLDTLAWYAIVTAYALVWFALAVAINLWSRSSAACASWCFGLWFAVAVVTPAAVDAAVRTTIPTASGRDLTMATRAARNAVQFDASEEQAAASLKAPDRHAERILEAFLQRHPQYRDQTRLSSWGRYGVVQAAKEEALAEIVAPGGRRMADANKRRERVVSMVAWVCPTLLASRALWRLANVDQPAQPDFRAQARDYDRRWKQFFWPRMFAGAEFEASDYDRIPRFSYAFPTREAGLSSARHTVAILALHVVALGVCLRLGMQRPS